MIELLESFHARAKQIRPDRVTDSTPRDKQWYSITLRGSELDELDGIVRMLNGETPQEVIDQWAADCDCCPECNQHPCGGVMQGGLCDMMPCRCEAGMVLEVESNEGEEDWP